ncbi:hypothetical protein FB451DRAFT_1305732 [Mycena latifolia]|nr:hypothetical protein FB451DRAFT_1305732 [Mycena latifolia]
MDHRDFHAAIEYPSTNFALGRSTFNQPGPVRGPDRNSFLPDVHSLPQSTSASPLPSLLALPTRLSQPQLEFHRSDDIANDMNAESTERALRANEFTSTQASGRQLSGVERTKRCGAGVRMIPYDVYHRPQIMGHSAITYPSTSVELGSSTDHQPEMFLAGNDNGPPFGPSAAMINNSVFPWERSQHQPKTKINGGTFIGGNVNHFQRHGERGLNILRQSAASDAFHDSVERFPQPKCHPETRTKTLDDLYNWSSQDDPSSRVIWLHGPAGAGKSAIAQSFCQKLEAEGRLGGSFFFKRGHSSRGNANRLFPTIAYQLALLDNLPKLKDTISQKVEDNPSILDRSFVLQLQKLIIEPSQQSIRDNPMVVIIDGLDECEGHNIQQEILRSIGTAIGEQHLPLRFFIASRPEPHISESFGEPGLKELHRPLNVNQSFEDIRKYLLDEFSRIHEEHRIMATVPTPWPSPGIVEVLVRKSSGYFIYASTVINFIDDKYFRPTERLDAVMGITELDFESPFTALDQLYTQILAAVPARPQLLRILTPIAAKFNLRVSVLERLLELKPGDLQLILRGLQSVIDLIEHDDSRIIVHHASFFDFLHDPTRSGPFYPDPQHRTDLARHLLKAFSYKKNDISVNQTGHFAWELQLDPMIFEYITSVQPSLDLVALVQSFNPDFFFGRDHDIERASQLISDILAWLKKAHPLPQESIRLWEDYHFMMLCDDVWYPSTATQVTTEQKSHNHQVLQASPQLIKVLRAFSVLPPGCRYRALFTVHIMLDLSWDKLRAAICPLQGILGDDKERLRELFISASHEARFGEVESTIRDLVSGGLHVLKEIVNGEVDRTFGFWNQGWGFLLRSCPPSPVLLQNLDELALALASTTNYTFALHELQDFNNLVQWLKTFPQPPLELITRFEHHLQEWEEKYMMFLKVTVVG